MTKWMALLHEAGIDPDFLIPEPLLLLPPEKEELRSHDFGKLPSFRGARQAFNLESELANLVVTGLPIERMDDRDFEEGLATALGRLPVNLRKGAFAKRRQWNIERRRLKRMALILSAILLLAIGTKLAELARLTFAVDRAAREALAMTGSYGGGAVEMETRFHALGGGNRFPPLAAALFQSVQETPNVQLGAMQFDKRGGLRATLLADTPASISAVQNRLSAAGFDAEVGTIRTPAGSPSAELRVKLQ